MKTIKQMQQTRLWMLAAILTFCGTMSDFAQNQKPSDLNGQPGTWVFMAKLSNPDDTLMIAFEKKYYASIWNLVYKHFNAIWEEDLEVTQKGQDIL